MYSYEANALLAFYLSRDDNDKSKLLNQYDRLDKIERSKTGKLLRLLDCLDATRKLWPAEIRIDPLKPVAGHRISFECNGEGAMAVVFLGYGGVGEVQFTKIQPDWTKKYLRVTDLARYCRKELNEQFRFEYSGEVSQEEEEEVNQRIGEG